jgi:glycosyltransferase involved in cell wall biosynthesis
MIFFVYAAENDKTIGANLGAADYSYFFVMKLFLPVLRRLGRVVIVKDIARLDAKFAALRARKRAALLLAFTPPHKTPTGLRCPTVPVFAWEYSTIPHESWGGDWRQNWAAVLETMQASITHSRFAAAAVEQNAAPDYAITSLPAPLWDEFSALARPQSPPSTGRWRLRIASGVVLDSQRAGLRESYAVPTPQFIACKQELELDGVIYTSVFNPNDGRKNWADLLSAFCFAFRDQPAATLIMKLAFYDTEIACGMVWSEMRKHAPFQCRVIAIQGYLDAAAYRQLVLNTTYIVNSSYGEGQCLPLMEFMSAGKPAIAPDHTGMADYVNTDNSFVVRSSAEWTHWPHDPRLLLRAFRYRIDWQTLRAAYLESFAVATGDRARYMALSEQATATLGRHCSREVIAVGLQAFLTKLGYRVELQAPRVSKMSALRKTVRRFIDEWKN